MRGQCLIFLIDDSIFVYLVLFTLLTEALRLDMASFLTMTALQSILTGVFSALVLSFFPG